MTKKIITVIALVIGIAAITGAYFFPKYSGSFGNSPVGTEFGTQKIAAVAWSLSSGSATSTSLYNGDQNDRVIESSFVACDTVGTSRTAYTGAGLASLILRAATTSADAPAIVSNTNYAVNISPLATSTPVVLAASSTEGVLNGYSRVWPSGSYLTFFSNATNTAQCTVGVKYFAR